MPGPVKSKRTSTRGRRQRCAILVVFSFTAVMAMLQQSFIMTNDYSSARLGFESILFSNSTQITAQTFAGDFPRTTTTSIRPQSDGTPVVTATNATVAASAKEEIPQNLRIVFVGDSLTRYMYLSLTYYLKNGAWAPLGHRLLEKVKDDSPDAWNKWLAYTNSQVQHEECDCYRYWTHPFLWYKHCENRYFHWGSNYVAFLTKFGGNPFHGHVLASDVFKQKGANQTLRHYDWVYPSWDRLVDEYISKWDPKPDLLVFNQGHWKAHELRDETVLKSFRRALRKHRIRGIYRTTTFRQDERVEGGDEAAVLQKFGRVSTRSHDALVCQYFACLNVSWTAGIPTTDYVDPVHFKAHINNRMNQQLLKEFVQRNGE